MTKLERVFGIAFVAFSLGGLPGCGNDNINACRTYVDQANRALVDCNRAPIYDPDETCPESLNDGPDCTQYYECLGNGYTCNDDMTVSIDIDECSC